MIKEIEQHLHKIVRQNRTTGHVNDRNAGTGFPIPPEIIGQAHAAGWVPLHGMYAAVGSARSGGNYGPRAAGQPVAPVAGKDRLASLPVGSESGPVSFVFILLVGDGSFDHENEGRQLTLRRTMKITHELVARLKGENRVMEVHLGNSGQGSEHKVLNAGLRGRGYGNGVAVTPEAGGDPKHINFLH